MKKDEEEWSQKRGKKNKILNSYWRNVCADQRDLSEAVQDGLINKGMTSKGRNIVPGNYDQSAKKCSFYPTLKSGIDKCLS